MADRPDTFDLAGQAEAQRKAREKELLQQKVEAEDLVWLMRDKRGRRHIFRHLEAAGVFRLSFNSNALTMAFNEGQRNEGLRTLALLMKHCPELHTQMLKEHSDNE